MKTKGTRTLATITLAVMGLNPRRIPIARGLLIGSILLAVPFSVHGDIITLQNPGFELPGGTGFPQATDWSSGTGSNVAQTALYSAFSAARKPGYESLGLSFAFVLPSYFATQTVSDTFAANSTYTFDGYGLAATGNNDLRFDLGYDNGGTFVSLATATYDLSVVASNSWTLLDGVSFTTGSSGAELGKSITVRLVGVQTTGTPSNGVWFDNVSLSVVPVVPEPSTAALFGIAAGLALLGYRRSR